MLDKIYEDLKIDEDEFHPLHARKDIVIVFLAGTHSVGKTTIGKELVQYYNERDISAWYIPEMFWLPKHKPGTKEFQTWYHVHMERRNNVIRGILDDKHTFPSVLVVDRTPIDVGIYDMAIEDRVYSTEVMFYTHELMYYLSQWSENNDRRQHVFYVNVERNIVKAMEGVKERQAIEGREGWDEDDMLRWSRVATLFKIIFTELDNLIRSQWDMDQDFNAPYAFPLYNDGTVEEAVDRLRKEIESIW